MTTEQIKTAIEALPSDGQAEIERWMQERPAVMQRRFHELKALLGESYAEVAIGGAREWNQNTLREIRDEAQARLSERQTRK